MSLVLTHRPAKGSVNTPFGLRPKPTPTSPAIHYGQDYGWGGGDTIVAAASGRVKSYAFSGAYGNRLVIDHGNGYETWYCHLTSAAVSPGETVRGGQTIAAMGATGNVTGKHLHFEVRFNGVAQDPLKYFSSSPASSVNSEEDDMPTVIDILNGQFKTGRQTADGKDEWVSVSQALTATYFYGDLFYKLLEKMPADVWAVPLVHPLAKAADGSPASVKAGDFLRYEPAEADNIRKAIEKIPAQSSSGVVGTIDYDKLAKAVADEIYRRGEK